MVVPVKDLSRFIKEAMMAVGTVHEHAEQMADLLVAADYRGHYSHGLNRLEMYVTDIENQTTDANAKPVVLKESPATAWVDGNNGLGPVVGNFCMQLAIEKAKSVGVGWVVAKRSNHYGIAGWYTRTALEHGLLGMSFTNTSPLMGPTRGREAALGTNPLSLAAPGKNGDSFVLDMATTAVAIGKIEVQRRKGEPITEGWAQDPQGQSTTDADLAFKTKCLMPLGGPEITSGYKGYGLGLLVETFCGILSGSAFGPSIRRWMEDTDRPADLGQCFVAINPQCFAPGFEDRMSSLMDFLRNMQPADPSKPVMVPGDPERNHMKLVDQEGGLRYHENQLKESATLASRLGIRPMSEK
jgi:LDH2 family malate/lactate/ureidoglycolate dehydrogenase